MLQIVQKFISPSAKERRSGLPLIAQSITVHSTGNLKATAKNEADNIVNNPQKSPKSFHAVVDMYGAYQVLPYNERAWHAGDGYKGPGNCTSIGIEICEYGDRKQTLLNAVELIQGIMKTNHFTVDNLFQHNHWSGKNCPRILRDPKFVKDGLDWNWFLAQFQVKEDSEVVEKGNFIINGKVIAMDRILNKNKNFVELTDLCEALKLSLSYDAGKKMPDIKTK